MHHRNKFLAVALAVSLGLAACGGGDDDEGLSRSDLVAKADVICAKAQADAEAVPVPASLKDADVAAGYFGKVTPITTEETADLKDLEPAENVKADWDSFIEKQEAADDLLQTINRKARDKDPSGEQDLQRLVPTGQAVVDSAKKVGADKCAQ